MKYTFFLLLPALVFFAPLCAGDEGPRKYVSFEQEGKAIDNFLSRTYDRILYFWKQGGKYLDRSREVVTEEAEKKRQEIRKDVLDAGGSVLRKGRDGAKDAVRKHIRP